MFLRDIYYLFNVISKTIISVLRFNIFRFLVMPFHFRIDDN